MSNQKKKSLLKNLKFKKPEINFSKFKLSISKFDLRLILIFLLIQALIAGFCLYKGIYHYPAAYLKTNYVEVIVLIVITISALYFTFRDYAKKVFSAPFLFTYLFIELVLFFNIIAINSDLEFILKKNIFDTGNYIFTVFFMIFTGVLVSKYDFQITSTFKEFYATSFNHFYKNLGIFIAFGFITAIITFFNVTFVYAISAVILVPCIYLAKAILANIRR